MKKIILLVAAGMLATSAMAAGPSIQQGQSQASNSAADAVNAGNNQTIIFEAAQPGESKTRVEYSGTQTVRNVPSVSGPPLISSNDTCMGSASAAINAPGLGIAIGKTYTDSNCVMLKNSREMWNMGMKAAALALMCNDAANKDALEVTGFECPQTTRDRKNAALASVAPKGDISYNNDGRYTGHDPIVRARMGYSR